MNIAAAKTLLKRYGFDETDPLVDWLNASKDQYLLEHDWDWRQAEDILTINAGDESAVLVGSGLLINSVFLEAGGQSIKLAEWPKSQALRELAARGGYAEYPQGAPTVYYIITAADGLRSVGLLPPPDTTYTLYVDYQARMSDFTADTDILPGPSEGHYAIVLGAAYIALQAENEEARASTAQGQYSARVSALIDRYNKPSLDEPSQVVDVMNYGNYS